MLEGGPWLIEGRKSDDFEKVAKGDGCALRPVGDGSCLGLFSSAGTSPVVSKDDQSDSEYHWEALNYLSTYDK